MNTNFPFIRSGASVSSIQRSCSLMPSLSTQESDRSICSRKTSSGRSVIIDPYFNMDFTTPTKKRQRKDESNQQQHHDPDMTVLPFPETPSPSSPQQPDGFRLRLRMQPLRFGRNILSDAETSYVPPDDESTTASNIIVDDDISSASSDSINADVCSNYYIDQEDRIDHVLLTPRNQNMWDPMPCTPKLVHGVSSRDSPSDFHVVSPSQPDLPFLPF